MRPAARRRPTEHARRANARPAACRSASPSRPARESGRAASSAASSCRSRSARAAPAPRRRAARLEVAADDRRRIADRQSRALDGISSSPACAAQQPDEERRADDRGEDAERHLDRRHRARQRVDEQQKPPPRIAAAGSRRGNDGPTRKRARCGTTRPTQPTMPAAATLAAVTSVAAATMTTRSSAVGAPSARASSSGSDITFSFQRSSSNTACRAAPARSAAAGRAASVPARLPSSQNVIAGNWLYGSARYFTSPMPAPSSEPTTMPVSSSVNNASPPRSAEPMA